MLTATVETLAPAMLRDITDEDFVRLPAKVVRVSTNDQVDARWPHAAQFFEWYDQARTDAGIKNDFEVATRARINHSSISSWRRGRQRPTAHSLSDIARVLGKSALEAWEKAGLLTEVDREQMFTQSERDGVALIRSSNLGEAAKERLIAVFLEQERRDRTERMRRLEEQIGVLSDTDR